MAELPQFVGDPFVDVGVAVLEHRVQKPCDEFTLLDLSKQAGELETLYSTKAWSGYLTVHFPNSCWCNATMSEGKKSRQRATLLRSFDAPAIAGKSCSYCRRPAQHIGDRSIIPLITGADTMTCGPGGVPGLPICSGCQFAIQFYPLAALKVIGRPLFWWTPDHAWMYELTGDFAKKVNRIIEGSPEQVPSLPWPSTRLLETVEGALERSGAGLHSCDLVGCHVTNYGSGPDYNELRINNGLVEFIRFGLGHPVYRAIRDGSWELSAPKSKKKAPFEDTPREMRRNHFYEDLGKFLRDGDVRDTGIVRRYFTNHGRGGDGAFELAAVFARKVLGMTQEQIEAIKELADRMSGSQKAADHLDRLFQRRGLTNYVRTIADISDRMVRAGERSIPLESVLRAFNMASEDDAFTRDASLVRELILLRIIEKLPSDRVPETQLEETEE